MSTTETTTERLWLSNGGRIACDRHLGGYATMELQRRPKAKRMTTPLDVWDVATEADSAEWVREIGEPMRCESCEATR